MNYAELILESEADLLAAEQARGSALNRDRARFLRLLKTRQCRSQVKAGAAVGLGARQSQRLWQAYRQGGWVALTSKPARRGWGKLSSAHLARLRQFLLDDQAQTLAHIQAYLAGSLGVHYTIAGVSALCKRLKIKLKTGRPVNVRQQPGAVEAFKKTSPG